jgi:pimeloyl-ACP methyl ester carboxylesterase
MMLLRKSLLLVLGGVVFFLIAGLVAVWAPDKPLQDLVRRWAGPPSQFLAIDGLQVHLRDEGPRDDPLPIVLLHGTSDSLHTWDGWAATLVTRRRVIRFDLAGFGLTGPAADGDHSVPRHVRQVLAVLDNLGVQRAVLGGNSLGGHVAWAAALAAPQRVAKLVLVDASGHALPPQEVPVALRLARVPGVRDLLSYFLPRGMVLASLRNVYGDASKVTPALVDRYYDMALRAGNRRALAHRVVDISPDPSARIRSLDLPTLILWGGRDRLTPLAAGRRFADDIAGSRLVVFEELGHLPHQEDAQRTVRELLRFLDGGQVQRGR